MRRTIWLSWSKSAWGACLAVGFLPRAQAEAIAWPQHTQFPHAIPCGMANIMSNNRPARLPRLGRTGAENRNPPYRLLKIRSQSKLRLSCSVTLGKKEPFLGKTIFSGAATKKWKKGATEQLSRSQPRGVRVIVLLHVPSGQGNLLHQVRPCGLAMDPKG